MLLLPLKHYDEAGTVLAPRWFYWMLGVACRDLLLITAFTAIPTESERLYRLFFPHSDTLYLQICAALPFLVVVVLVSFREKLWQKGLTGWRKAIRPLCIFGVLLQLAVIGSFLNRAQWQFNGYLGAIVLLLLAFSYMINRSHHIAVMLRDWQQPPVKISPP